jgi:hypothetical protein
MIINLKKITCITYVMQIIFYKVTLKIYNNDSVICNSGWYSALSNLYGNPGSNYDGYVYKIHLSDTLDSLSLHCYIVESTGENDRLKQLKQTYTDWSLYRKSTVANTVICYALHLGYKIKGYTIQQI